VASETTRTGKHLITALESLDTLADGRHDTGDVAVKDGGEPGVHADILTEKHVVDRVQARGFHLNENLSRGGHRDGNISGFEAGFRSATSRDKCFHRLHGDPPSWANSA
jgi:hypothetical protein